jgi:phenylalanyl-tRNA synthetase beta chain
VAGIAQGGFLHVKGVVETLYAALDLEPSFARASEPLFHPGKCAATAQGVLGELHPRRIEGTWGAFELDLGHLFAAVGGPVVYRDVITYPAVRQDIAVAVPEDVPVGELVASAREAAGEELREIRVFDVYRGDQVGYGRKSVAFSVAYQSAERTLTDDDASRLRGAILDSLADRFGAELR